MRPLPPPLSHPLPCAPAAADDLWSTPAAAVARLSGTVLVPGAGGKMGLHLTLMPGRAARLARPPLRVVAVSRFQSLRKRDCPAAAGVETIVGDLSDPRQVARLLYSDTNFFLAGVKFGVSSSPELLEQMNVVLPAPPGGSSAARRSPRCGRFCNVRRRPAQRAARAPKTRSPAA